MLASVYWGEWGKINKSTTTPKRGDLNGDPNIVRICK